jgi:hypothetical protein
MAGPNQHSFAKRKREMDKRRKTEEKRAKKEARKAEKIAKATGEGSPDAPDDVEGEPEETENPS